MVAPRVNQPIRPASQLEQQAQSPFDKMMDRVLKGVQIAQTAYGIKSQIEHADLFKAQAEFARAKAAAQPTAEQAKAEQDKKALLQDLTIQDKKAAIKQKIAGTEAQYDLIADRRYGNIKQMRDEWKQDQNTRRLMGLENHIKTVRKMVDDKGGDAKGFNAIDDNTLIFKYIKMIDDGTNVTQGDRLTVDDAGSYISKLTIQLYNKTLEGNKLDDTVRQNIINSMETMYSTSAAEQNVIDQVYRNQAAKNKFDPEQVVLDIFSDTPAKSIENLGQEPLSDEVRKALNLVDPEQMREQQRPKAPGAQQGQLPQPGTQPGQQAQPPGVELTPGQLGQAGVSGQEEGLQRSISGPKVPARADLNALQGSQARKVPLDQTQQQGRDLQVTPGVGLGAATGLRDASQPNQVQRRPQTLTSDVELNKNLNEGRKALKDLAEPQTFSRAQVEWIMSDQIREADVRDRMKMFPEESEKEAILAIKSWRTILRKQLKESTQRKRDSLDKSSRRQGGSR